MEYEIVTNRKLHKLSKKRWLSILCLTSFCLILYPTNVDVKQPTNDMLISYKNNDGKEFIFQHVTKVEKVLSSVGMVRAEISQKQLAELKENKNIEFIDKSTKKMTLEATPSTGTNSLPSLTSYWNMNMVKAPTFWKKGYMGNGVKVAVIDTGVNNIPDLKNVVKHVSFVKDDPKTKTIDESDPWDRGHDGEGHGTSVAAVIGAQIGGKTFNTKISDIIGVAPKVQLYSLKYADGTKDGSIGEVIEAINWSIQHKMDIINLSSSIYENNSSLKKAIDKAVKAGLIFVASAGNEGSSTPTYPARYSNVIAVSSVGKNKKCSDFSNIGTAIDFAAPGDYIPTINSKGQFFYASGTSYAAPHVAGLMALLKEKYPYSSSSELIQKLKASALDLGSKGKDTKYGYGLAQLPKLSTIKLKELTNVKVSKIKDHSATITYTIPNDSTFKKVALIINGKVKYTTKASYTLKNLYAQKSYNVLLKVINNNGDSSVGVTQTFQTKEDITPPNEISSLKLSNLKIDSATLAWTNPVDDDFDVTEVYLNGKLINTANLDYLSIKHLQPNTDYQILLNAIDKTGNKSHGISATIHTPAAKTIPTPAVYSVTTSSHSISGKAKPNTFIVVKKESKSIIAKGRTNQDGKFKLNIPFQAVNTTLTITAEDSVGNRSKARQITIQQSKKAAQPIVQKVTTNTKYLRGEAELDSKVFVYRGSTLLASGKVDSKGYFLLYIKNQTHHTTLTIYIKDRLGIKSKPLKVVVQ